MLPERFAVGLTPLPTAARVARQRSALRMRIISALISLAVLVGILVFLNPGWSRELVIGFIAIWVATSAIWLGLTTVGLQRAKRDLASIGHGDAFYIDGRGIEFVHPTTVHATWSEITALRIAGGSLGAGPSLVMEVGGQRAATIPLSFVDATPSAIDSATSARSLGRVRVDVSGMDRMF
ncbi:hypothetical protein [Tessaracoccus antarcticus]|uniref:Uncharacterized protein n=1 Tax=Tessaracoccus antarcticus TaxID=2479848 RepID=A0A3M0GAL8_9ACTN|nr:hypothetical protein [Tessaracoccus antarcticus]RMB62021.1 hypothetical protein EAX62_05400 [Tessaracoccus antarcticus]